MLKRLLLVMILMLLPIGALADDTAATTETTTPADGSPDPTTTDPSASASGLGPQTSAPAGGSNADAAGLQPAGLSPIQSTTTDSTGLTAPANALQAPAVSTDQLQVLAGEADGAPQELDDSGDALWVWDALALLVILISGTSIVLRDRRRFRRTELLAEKPSE
jgi:hypothetical protein